MFKSIKHRLIFVVTLIVLIIVMGISFFIYGQTKQKIEQLMGSRAQSIASTSATLISGDQHRKITENLQDANDMPEWKNLQQSLARIREKNKLEEDVYTMMDAHWIPKDKENPYGMVFFTAFAKSKDFLAKGQKKEKYIDDSIKNKKSGHTEIIDTINGSFITGYAPIITSDDTVTGVLEVALEVGKEINAARLELIKSIGTTAFAGLIIALILVVFASQKISSPIKTLTEIVQKMANGNMNIRVTDIKSRDEIAVLGHGFNEMATNLEKSYKELENYSLHLEEMVSERTAELASANARIQAMLDNMKLSVFSIDDQEKIRGPVSAYSNEIFQAEVESENIYNILYKDIDPKDEVYSNIKSTLVTVFDEDLLQWDLMQDELPREITLLDKVSNESKYLEIKYSPLMDDEERLKQILFVVDDVTELKRLEKEAALAKEQNDIQNKILTQLSNISVDSLESNLVSIKNMIQKIEISIENRKIDDIFILFHTIKGNSRFIGLDLIAIKVHEIESGINEFKNNIDLTDDQAIYVSELIKELVLILSRYNDTASNIFKIRSIITYPNPANFIRSLISHLSREEDHEKYITSLLEKYDLENFDDKKQCFKHVLNDPFHSPFLSFSAINENMVISFSMLVSSFNKSDSFLELSEEFKPLPGVANLFINELITLSKQQRYIPNLKEDLNKLDTFFKQIALQKGLDPRELLSNGQQSSPLYNQQLEKDTAFASILEFSKNHGDYGEDFALQWNDEDQYISLDIFADNNLKLPTSSLKSAENNYYASLFNILICNGLVQLKEKTYFREAPESLNINKSVYEQYLLAGDIESSPFEKLTKFPIEYFIQKYQSRISKVCLKEGKKARIEVLENSIDIAFKEFQIFEPYISQLLVNSVVHGIESGQERQDKGKKKIGNITLAVSKGAGELTLHYADDGMGFNTEKLKNKIPEINEMSDKEIFDFLLSHSVSSNETADIYSGMGEGLSVLGKAQGQGIININYITTQTGFNLSLSSKC